MLKVLNNNIATANNDNSGLIPIMSSSNQRLFDGGNSATYHTEYNLNSKDVLGHEQAFDGFRSDQSGRAFQQGSDGDSLPESPMSSGHDGKSSIFFKK